MNDVTLAAGIGTRVRGRAGSAVRPLAGSTALVVLGMHRSGTSALAGMLRHLGVEFGERLMPPSPDNPRGYWEHRDIVAVHHALMAGLGYGWDDIRPMPSGFAASEAARRTIDQLTAILQRDFAAAPVWGLKDPRLCRLMPLWTELFARLGIIPRFVLALRHPAEVAASLSARDGLSAPHACFVWLRHVLEAEWGSRGYPRAVVHYEELVAPPGWRAAAEQIAHDTAMSWPVSIDAGAAAIDDYLAAELRRQRGGDDRQLHRWVERVYRAFRAGEGNLIEACDAVRRELEVADQLFAPVIDQTSQVLLALQAQRHAQDRAFGDLTQSLGQIQRELDGLRGAVERGGHSAPGQAGVTAQGQHLPPPPLVAEAYPRWIASRASTAAARADWVAERVAEWPYMPRLALGMMLPAGNEACVALTLRSLLTQTVGDWELHVAAEGEMPAGFADPRVVWLSGEGATAERLNRSLAASGAEFTALIDAGDQLPPHALFSVGDALFRHPEWRAAYSDEDRIDLNDLRSGPHFKPDVNLDLLRSLPYVGGLLVVRREVFGEIGGFDPHWDGTEEYDLALRLAERLGPGEFGHIADILYHRLTISGRSRRPVAEICADMPKVVQAHLDRLGIAATAETGVLPHACRVRYHHDGPEPLVSIIVPTKNQLALLKRCVEGVLQKTAYENYEVIVVDNGSDAPDACDYLQRIEDKRDEIGSRIRVLRHPGEFNFAAINNRAVREEARGDYLCLLNNDAAPLDPEWLSEMMALARRPEVGAVGAKLLFPDGRIQHGGVILGTGRGAPAEHPYIGEPENSLGYWGRLQAVQSLSAVTAACLVTRRSAWDSVGGFDEENFAVLFNDVDYCLKLREAGYLVLWTPHARLVHETSASLKANLDATAVTEKNARGQRERLAMYRRWRPQIAFDPAYNRNLSSFGCGFAVETEGAPTWDPEFRPRPRVIVHPADREGCGEYRIIAPSRAAFAGGVLHAYETMRLTTAPELARIDPDSIVFQRQLDPGQIEAIERVKNTSPAFRVFELDDLITNLPPKSIHRKAIGPDIGERVKRALALCNRLVVSTEPLARQYRKWCDETVVRPNWLEKRRWAGLEAGRRDGPKPRVGWAGALGHSGDLALIAGVVEATAREVDWIFFGMCPDPLRRFVAEYHEWAPLDDYPRRLAGLDLDLAIAPLEEHPFNEAKSNLRLLEYGVLGYPVVCTDILPYQGALPVTRLRNRHRDWVRTIRDLAADRDACRRAGLALRDAVLADWMLEDHLDELKRSWLP